MSLSGIRNGNVCIYQGDDFACVLTILNCSDGQPADLTDFTAQAQIRTGPADQNPGQVAAQFTCTVLVPSQVSLWLAREHTQQLNQLEYVWDLQLTASGGQVTTVLSGDVDVMLEVTRRDLEGHHMWDAVVASQPLWRPVVLCRDPTGLTAPWGRNDPWSR